tara:strand:- start:1895 stop:2080 length:186 start_codon:yes stop_codon:yes gene_type:complete
MTKEDEYLTRCVVDTTKRTFYLYSNEGDTKEVHCEDTEEFMNVLSFIRKTLTDELVYTAPD